MELEKLREDQEWLRTRTLGYLIYCSIPEGKKKKKSMDAWWPWGNKEIPAKEERFKKYEGLLNG